MGSAGAGTEDYAGETEQGRFEGFARIVRALALSRRGGLILLACLGATAVLQAAAASTPYGDDIPKYIEAARALLDGRSYPVHQAGPDLQAAGMAADSPALPALPVMLALFFATFGQSTGGLSAALAGIAVAFPFALFYACTGLMGNGKAGRLAAYATTIFLVLFPVYQIHVLGTPQTDTLFVTLLLLTAGLAARADRTADWKPIVGMGLASGLVANTRPEGIDFSAATMLVFMVFHGTRKRYWLALLSYLASLAPFSLTYFVAEGALWPTTFNGTLSFDHVPVNLAQFGAFSLPWYRQAIGLNYPGLVAMLLLVLLSALASVAILVRTRPALLFVPLLGLGYIGSSFLIHPLVLMPYTPVDSLRHWSSGIPYIVISAAFALYWGYAHLPRLFGRRRGVLIALAVGLFFGTTYYEVDRLAHPEPYFAGRASLLWTGSSFLLTDVLRHPVPFPPVGAKQSAEETREYVKSQLARMDLRAVNRSEAYHWTTLIFVVFGTLYLLVAPASPRAVECGTGPDLSLVT